MPEPLRLMAVLAHPDDESLGTGGLLARSAAEGVETHLVTATRGERGRYFDGRDRPSDEEVGRIREGELRDAARELGLQSVHLLGYVDGALDRADPVEAVARIAARVDALQPHVVVTFDPFGAYGHPDHVAISQLTTAALVEASHRVSKLYYFVDDAAHWETYQSAFKRLVSRVDGVEREVRPWPDWSITTRIDTRAHWETVWRAIRCHRTQLAIYGRLAELDPAEHESLWGSQMFYRAFSRVNGGRERETDVFEGLREAPVPETES